MADRDRVMTEVNEYLACEWGFDEDEDADEVGPASPFELTPVGRLDGSEVFSLRDGDERFFAFHGRVLRVVRAGGMSFADLRLHELGSAWIADRDPVELGMSRLGDPQVPSGVARRAAAGAAAEAALGRPCAVIEGLYLAATGEYVVLAEVAGGERFLVWDGRASRVADAVRGLSAPRQVSHAVGARLA